jgi:copper transport protein
VGRLFREALIVDAEARRKVEAGKASMRRPSVVLVVGLTFAGVLALSGTASAHAGFISATPEPGSEVRAAPRVVILRFTEPLNERLSRAQVTTPDGSTFAGTVTGAEAISIDLTTSAEGIYRATWMTVSLVDGHTLTGSFAFGVGIPPGPAAVGSTATSPSTTDLLISLARGVEDLALLLSIGLLLIGRLGRRDPSLPWLRTRPTPGIAVALAGGSAVVLGEALAAAHSFSPGAVVSYLTTGIPGVARLSRPMLELAALMLSVERPRWTWVPLGCVVVALAAAGHAAAVDPAWWGIVTETIHVGAAALWAGGILALAVQRPPGGWTGIDGRAFLKRFTPVALGAFALTALAGVLRGVQEVGSWHALLHSPYGVALVVKTSLVVLVVQLSFLAWRQRVAVPKVEGGFVAAALAVAALLAGYPLPPARATGVETAAHRVAKDPGLPGAGDLTLGGRAGTTLVGLTLSPGEPGRNDVFVYVLPLAGERRVPVALSLDERQVALDSCGTTCRRTALDLSGGEHIEVRVGGSKTPAASFDVPHLPAPDGTQLFAQLEQRMHALTSYRLSQSLNSGTDTLRTNYECRAPGQMRARSTGGFQTVWIGGTEYLKRGPGAGWLVESGGPSFPVLSFVWDDVPDRVLDPRIVGTAHVDGVDTTILSFYGPLGSAAYWFRLWVDPTGLVRRTEMRAQGHFMDQRYSAFDAPIVINPPKGVGT